MTKKLLKLISGDYVIGDVEESKDSEKMTLGDPLIVNLMPTDNNQLGISLFPLNPFDREITSVSISKDHILFEVENIPDQITNQHIKATSGIEVADEMPSDTKMAEKD